MYSTFTWTLCAAAEAGQGHSSETRGGCRGHEDDRCQASGHRKSRAGQADARGQQTKHEVATGDQPEDR